MSIESVSELEELLSVPSDGLIDDFRRLPGDLLVLGVAGKMGPTLARMALRATQLAGVKRRVIGVARFTDPAVADRLSSWGVEVLSCDLMAPGGLESLPAAPNVVAMTAMKFGATEDLSGAWGVNAWLSARIAERYAGSRIVAFSTGNVYPLSPIGSGGSKETDPLNPVGEYGMSCLGKERMYEFFSRKKQSPTAIVRLNYACELRYGVLVDIAMKVLHEQPIDAAMGHVNVIWQGDANRMALSCLALASTPPFVVNVAGPETLSVREVAGIFGDLFGRKPQLAGAEADHALLSNGRKGHRLFGYPTVSVLQMCEWIADWLRRGQPMLNKPTHFQTRDGKF